MKTLYVNPTINVENKSYDTSVKCRDVEAKAEAGSEGSGSGPFSVEAEGRKFHRFRFHIGGKNGERKEIGCDILQRRANRRRLNIKK